MNTDRIPAELRAIAQWLLWKTKKKIPHQVNGELASVDSPETWNTFESVLERFNQGGYDGIGFVFTADDPYCGIDLDGCRNRETGAWSPWAREIIQRFSSYTELSPSGTGAKIFVRGCSPWPTGRNIKLHSEVIVCEKKPGIEVYDKGRYFAVTGQPLAGTAPEIVNGDDALAWLAEQHKPKAAPVSRDFGSASAVIDRARKYLGTVEPSISGQGGHNQAFKAACILVLGFGLSTDDALGLMREWNQTCQPPWSERELLHKVTSADQQTGERNYLRNARPEQWQAIAVPEYETEIEVSVTTLESASRDYLQHLQRNGTSLIELGLPDLDYAIGGGVEYGEMVILAARPSHGKSCVALQAIHHVTAKGMPCIMVSEEMSALALGKRVIQYASTTPQEHWRYEATQVNADLDSHFGPRADCFIVESCRTVDKACDAIRKASETKDVRFAVVDYAQLLGAPGKTRYEQTTNVSIALRQTASSCKVVLLALCQLNRGIESRDKFIPTSADLKDTGQLEQDADVILFVVWPHRIDSKCDPHEYLFFVGKNRNRSINAASFKCAFNPGRQMLTPEKLKIHQEFAEYAK